MRFVILGIVLVTFLLFGCAAPSIFSENETGANVNKTETVPIRTYECPNGELVTDMAACPTCPPSCDDSNPCTIDSCNRSTKYGCAHLNLDGSQPGCEGNATALCSQYTCSAGKCIAGKQNPYPACVQDSDCNDSNKSTIDICLNMGKCNATCQHNLIDYCLNGDGACPANCTPLTDNDCIPMALGQTGIVSDRVEITLTSVSTRECFAYPSAGPENSWRLGHYVVIPVTIKNGGRENYKVNGLNFFLRDSLKPNNNYETTPPKTTISDVTYSCQDILDNYFPNYETVLAPGAVEQGYLAIHIQDAVLIDPVRIVYDTSYGLKSAGQLVWQFNLK